MKGQISFLDEIIVDNFAGGGGASTGIELAAGRPVTIAINHDPDAIAMHMVNHKFTEHYQDDVWVIDPREICKGRKVGLAWFSPDCKHFSRAKGGKPVDKQIRGLAWVAVKWARYVKPRVIMLENVPEFQTWCPIGKDNRPIKSRSGETFRKFVRHLQREGYIVKWAELSACDFGAPTIRRRFFLIARCDGQPIKFPQPTHGNGKGLKPYRTAAECIDWSIPCKSIFGRSKPLAENTMRRIARGLDKFTIKSDKPFIIPIGYGERVGQAPRVNSIDNPLSTIVSSCKQNLVVPHISKYFGGIIGSDVSEPLSTITAIDHNALVAPSLSPHIMSNNTNNTCKGLEEPVPTITTGNRNFLTSASLIQYHTEQGSAEVRGQALNTPVMTLDTSPRYGLMSAHVVKYYSGDDNYSDVQKPLHTITVKERNALVESHLCIFRHNEDCRTIDAPLPTVTTSGAHFAEIRTRIARYTDGVNLGNWVQIREMLNAYCGYTLKNDEILLININSNDYFIDDIGMRMLEPRELYRAQGFPDDYIIDFDVNGKQYSRSAQVARCGNSVPPPFAEALVRANLPELCSTKFVLMSQLMAHMAM